MVDVYGKKVSISFELYNSGVEYHECEENFYDMVVRFQNKNEIDELISKLMELKAKELD